MTTIPIVTADDRDLARCLIIAKLCDALENAGHAIDQLAAPWPKEMRDAAADVVRNGENMARTARETIA